MRYQFYKLFNFLVSIIPRRILRQMLNALHRYPETADRAGYQVFPQNFYNPFPVPSEVNLAKLDQPRFLPKIDPRVADAVALLDKLSQYTSEAESFLKNRTGNLARWDQSFPQLDSTALYSMLRRFKPKRYIEVGCGYSSRASTAALNANAAEKYPCAAAFIEPYPGPHLTEWKLAGEFIHKKIEDVPLEKFQELEAGDVLFIDTSHVIKVQNDVEYELLRVLPSLKPGVLVHIHDIFTPYDYPAEWLVGTGTNRGGNNEQYALECLLSGGDDWEIVLPVYLLWRENRAALQRLCKSDARPASFWIRKRVRG